MPGRTPRQIFFTDATPTCPKCERELIGRVAFRLECSIVTCVNKVQGGQQCGQAVLVVSVTRRMAMLVLLSPNERDELRALDPGVPAATILEDLGVKGHAFFAV